MLSSVFGLVLSAGLVAGHAYVTQVSLAGTTYSGWLPFSDPWESPRPARIVRQVPNDSPITDPFSPDLACNVGGENPAGITGDIAAGQSVTFTWNTWPADHAGPITVWLASCGSSCSTFPTSSARWFPIDKRGLNADGSYATDDLIAAGFQWTTTIPANLAPGEYLLRIELLALHAIAAGGAAQMYPSCSQIRVSGSGNAVPADGEAVAIQDVYRSYTYPNVWASLSSFPIAGPAVASFISGAPAPAPPPASNPTSATISEGPASSSTSVIFDPAPTVQPGNGICKRGKLIRRRKQQAELAKRTQVEPVHARPLEDLPVIAGHKQHLARRHHRDFHY